MIGSFLFTSQIHFSKDDEKSISGRRGTDFSFRDFHTCLTGAKEIPFSLSHDTESNWSSSQKASNTLLSKKPYSFPASFSIIKLFLWPFPLLSFSLNRPIWKRRMDTGPVSSASFCHLPDPYFIYLFFSESRPKEKEVTDFFSVSKNLQLLKNCGPDSLKKMKVLLSSKLKTPAGFLRVTLNRVSRRSCSAF